MAVFFPIISLILTLILLITSSQYLLHKRIQVIESDVSGVGFAMGTQKSGT